jgi:hypothetical protein
METKIMFADRKLKEEYESLEHSAEFSWLHKALNRAFADILDKPSIGVPLKKYRIPKDFANKKIDNLWKYDLPSGWRLLYSLGREGITIIALVLEWCDHDSYQKRYSGRK